MLVSLVYLFPRMCIIVKLDMIHSYLLYSEFGHIANRIEKNQTGYKEYKGNVLCKIVANYL